MTNQSKTHGSHRLVARRELHIYATQRSKPRGGSGTASVDIHAWVLTLTLAFLLRDDLSSEFPLQLNWPPGSQAVSNTETVPSNGALNAVNCISFN